VAHVAAILVAQALASSIRFAPGGFALKLGIFLLAFADAADAPTTIAFIVLYELTLYATNFLVGFLSLGYLFRGACPKDVIARICRIGDRGSEARPEPVELHDGARLVLTALVADLGGLEPPAGLRERTE